MARKSGLEKRVVQRIQGKESDWQLQLTKNPLEIFDTLSGDFTWT